LKFPLILRKIILRVCDHFVSFLSIPILFGRFRRLDGFRVPLIGEFRVRNADALFVFGHGGITSL